MTTYHTKDGASFEADTPKRLLQFLRAESFNPEGSLREYCTATAIAARQQTGKLHRAWPPAKLVADLMKAELVTPDPAPRYSIYQCESTGEWFTEIHGKVDAYLLERIAEGEAFHTLQEASEECYCRNSVTRLFNSND